MHHFSAGLLAALATTASAIVADWQQCGGISFTGDTQCATGSGCVVINPYYSQCQPGAAPVEPAPATSTVPGAPSAPSATGTPAGSGPGKTLQSGYYWIRGVAAPNYHKYMQTSPLYSPGSALLGDYTTAGQFQVVDGQLVQLVSAPGEPAKLLYATVSPERVINNASLAVAFTAEKNTYGAFKFGGDDLQWSAPGVSRPNPSAWYVCQGQKMYVNLGSYAYQTPSGCADQTIHYYNDKTANNRRARRARA